MITTRGEVLLSSGLLRWLVGRFAVYVMVALFAGQDFIGVAGLGKGGEWIIPALACETFCAVWIAKRHGWFPTPVFRTTEMDQTSRSFKIISATPDITNVSLVEASGAETIMLRRLLTGAAATGTCFVMHGRSKEVLGVLLSRDEYELLTAAALIARDPERLEKLLHEPSGMGNSVESVEQAFGITES
jgi:hypothetical protein